MAKEFIVGGKTVRAVPWSFNIPDLDKDEREDNIKALRFEIKWTPLKKRIGHKWSSQVQRITRYGDDWMELLAEKVSVLSDTDLTDCRDSVRRYWESNPASEKMGLALGVLERAIDARVPSENKEE